MSSSANSSESNETEKDLVPLTSPREGVPKVTETKAELASYVERLQKASGPVAVDAERASGFTYGQDAYLVQIKREGAGIALIDPRALPDLSVITQTVGDEEWILHAADQDLPCLAAVGMLPTRIFDTELAGRLLNKPRVGLGPMVAAELGLALAKEHSAADWSRRPLPANWLTYAALDVEILIELKSLLSQQLSDSGKLSWALEEFDAILTAPPAEPRPEPWRRTSGSHALKDSRQLAVVRSLWAARDTAARKADIAPGRILPDSAIVAAAKAGNQNLRQLREFQRPSGRRRMSLWAGAVTEALNLPDSKLPNRRAPRRSGPPQPRAWKDKAPEAAARLEAVKRIVRNRAVDLNLPQENLLTPDYQRRLAWEPPVSITPDTTASRLSELGARTWQIEQLAEPLVEALTSPNQIIETMADPLSE